VFVESVSAQSTLHRPSCHLRAVRRAARFGNVTDKYSMTRSVMSLAREIASCLRYYSNLMAGRSPISAH
jgi:hypothetical protein